MLSKARAGSLSFKILGWFWLTLLASYAVASVSAFIIPVPVEQRAMSPQSREGSAAIAGLIAEHALTSEDAALATREDKFIDWAIFDAQGNWLMDTATTPDAAFELVNNLERQREPVDLFTTNYVVSGPQVVNVENIGDIQVVFWRERYPRLIDRIRSLPAWFPIGMALLTTLIMSLLFYRSIVKPLQRISNGFSQLATGDLDYRLGKHCRHDEFGTLYDNFDRMAAQLSSLIKSQHRLSADISHELKTPLSRMQMALALARTAPEGKLEGYLDRAESEGEKLDELIKQLLQLAKIKSRPLDYGIEVVAVGDLLSELVDDAQFEADALNLSLRINVNAQLQIAVDGRLLLMAIENLVRNAFRYAQTEVTLKTQSTAAELMFEICDDGPGVSEAELTRLVRPFYRADTSRDRDTGGVGLGLAIAAEAVTVHHGRLTFHNLATGGLCARLYIPLSTTNSDSGG